ncbi:unnamed protein product [Oppiella nova]|uniref:Uncharacterized protein n=1 Tax=Oppiella nova TaxID=334625 RepID=A0A7R9L7S2_9ACAR|nr:unnamed protein product [Oppiella nova]CAG2157679.1 unnamed protein product [Oppiella nova]
MACNQYAIFGRYQIWLNKISTIINGFLITFKGADAETVEESVTQVLEQQIKGIDNLLYFSSSSDSSGRARISISFENGTDPDTAQVQVQNSINGVLNRLPDDVQRQGKSNNIELGDYLSDHIEQELSRIEGIGEVDVFGSQYAMRIWLNPNLLRQYQLMPSDIRTAIEAQNTQVAAGGVDGSYIYLKDVARIELGAENYQSFNTINGYPSSGMGISLSSGANALATSALIKAELAKISEKLPQGYKIVYPRDNTPFVQESIKEVVKTLLEAIVLVVLVMFIFLQSWRATLVPTITVPIVILVLAIGLLVDDAIVVVENVERLMHEQGLTAKQASIESMQEMTGALIGITVVLTAVFIPMAFFTGSTGVIYRQFSITLVAAMAFFIPSEDQGMLSVQFRLADGAPMSSSQVVHKILRKQFVNVRQSILVKIAMLGLQSVCLLL